MSAAEEWRPFPGSEERYEISSHGRVRSVARTFTNGRGQTYRRAQRVRQTQLNPNGYPIISVYVGGQRQVTKSVHTAVALAFLGPRPEGTHVAHGDGNPENNHVDNLRYATPSENERDKRQHGTNTMLLRTHCPQGHPYTPENTKREGPEGSHRKCRTCANARGREYAASGKRRAARRPVETEALQIRRWAAERGIEVAPTGRLSNALRDDYRRWVG